MQPIQIWKISALFLAGLVVGLIGLNLYLLPQLADSDMASPDDAAVLNESKSDKRIKLVPASVSILDQPSLDKSKAELAGDALNLGDGYFASGNNALALNAYRDYGKLANPRTSNILLRIAACHESDGHYQQAGTTYQTALAVAKDANHRALAIAGFARVLIRQRRIEDAIGLLSEQSVKLQIDLPLQTRAQIGLQWARSLEGRAMQAASTAVNASSTIGPDDKSQDFSYPDMLSVVSAAITPDELIVLLETPFSPAQTNLPAQRMDMRILQRPSDSADLISLSVSTSLQPTLLLLADIKSKTGLEIQLSDLAHEMVESRSTAIELEVTTLSTLLDHLFVPYSLTWRQNGSFISVVTEAEAKQQGNLKEFVYDSATRAFRSFEFAFQDKKFRTTSLMSRCRLAVMQGKLQVAENLYRELEQIQLTGESLASLFLNQGKLSMMLGQPEQAVKFFYQAVDQTLDPNIESSGYCFLSHLHLSAGQLEESIKTGGRALSVAVTVRQRSFAAVNQARSYILMGDPFSANEALFKNKEFIKTDGHFEKIASVLGAFARTRGLNDKLKVNNEKAHVRLLTALSALPDSKDVSFADQYISSLAYSSLGWKQHALGAIDRAIASPDGGAWRRQLSFEAALLTKEFGQTDRALAILQSLTTEDDSWRVRALEEIASMFVDNGQVAESITVYRTLWKSPLSDQQKAETLKGLGLAYQKQGKHYAAVLCFSGILPKEN